ncbi:MAG: hypothetical protein HRU03_09360, partial [Nanoarchaeales archaeon]|nr:hypothetical protein [Nanoarchaeales archaeon]
YNSSEYGEKKHYQTWVNILRSYENIIELYEDTPINLQAAAMAVNFLKQHRCKLFKKLENK